MHIVVIADDDSDEVRDAIGDLKAASGRRALLVRFESVADAIASAPAESDLIVRLQTRPWQDPIGTVERLYAAFPLARWVVGLGAWCQSARRRERLWPEAHVVPIAGIAARVRNACREIEAGLPPFPQSASREEVMLRETGSAAASLPKGALIRIESPDRALGGWLSDVVSEAGGVPVYDPSGSRIVVCDGLLWDADPFGSRRWLPVVKNGFPAGLVALAGLPTADLRRRLHEIGARAVLQKPCRAEEIINALCKR